ncbi:16S rRNA (cytosine(967)-C(5))-methyltransferase RsmB [Francisella philomiragia]|uniref:16S rRNA (cytosine(967)-C(5))-methyltransferase RsmB n=1 Tax=Francisella philomiragia TaxID=28110 RepID=UPI001B8B015C|nr:16S rRNA (cytosine(967)-C(5))-methyltransferase RsmB [Francisella philomiragia]QUE30870.1 16S rRNA (cytosine(967)-C(5))-methyltransferase RsmB [Francisella philomiragia]
MNTRAVAAKSILDIIDNRYSLLTIERKLIEHNLSDKDKSFVKLLCYEFFRNYYSLENVASLYLAEKTKLKAKILVMLGILQIFEINQPHYASINETVSACKNLKILWAKKLINGVLRQIVRDLEDIRPNYTEHKNHDLAPWLSNMLKEQYPVDFQKIAKAVNSKADMFIRLNEAKDPQYVIDYFDKNNISHSKTELKSCIKLDKAIDVKNNTLFQQGYFSVQDISAQYMGHIINVQNNDIILDACAAPGGKTTHILELAPQAKITAIDIIDKRLKLLKENITRIVKNNHVNVIKHDLTQPLAGQYNKIILDAPCSALGTLKRNPDIKVLRKPQDIKSIQTLQAQILDNLWCNNLLTDGYLLYITCSILQQENQLQIKNFLSKHQDAEIVEIKILENYKTDYGYQILPTEEKGDGFYYCLIKKISS